MEGEERGNLGMRWEDGGERDGRESGSRRGERCMCVCGVWVIVHILAFV